MLPFLKLALANVDSINPGEFDAPEVGSWHSFRARLVSMVASAMSHDLAEASRLHLEALELCNQVTVDVQHFIVYRDFASFLLKEVGLACEAIKFYQTALGMIKSRNSYHSEAEKNEDEFTILNHLAQAHIASGDFRSGRDCYEQCYSVIKSKASHRPSVAVDVLMGLCLSNIQVGSWEMASSALKDLEGFAARLRDREYARTMQDRCKTLAKEIAQKSTGCATAMLNGLQSKTQKKLKKAKRMRLVDMLKKKGKRLRKNFSKGKECYVCHEKMEKVFACGACENIYYCCKAHQKQDWQRHKKECFKQTSLTK